MIRLLVRVYGLVFVGGAALWLSTLKTITPLDTVIISGMIAGIWKLTRKLKR